MRRALLLFLALTGALAAWRLGDSYIDRLPDHRGTWLVPVEDSIAGPRPAPPRHTIVIVVDGERYDAAHGMESAQRLAAVGRCAPTNVGTLSVSRPVYAVISTGLEQDRTGARNNDDTSPLAAESIWEIARQAGLVVKGISELDWWRQLFPRGFDDFTIAADRDNHFANLGARLGDVNLIHPVYVDETAHDHGAASPEYRAAVARVDRELGGLLDEVDFQRDLVVLTADHGHSATGGHGGMDPEIVTVLTCFAGRGVPRGGDQPWSMQSRDLAPALAVLLGLRFPKDMRAGDDDLDTIWKLVAPDAFSADYLRDRHAAIERFRAANRAQLARWLGSSEADASWPRWYAHEHLRQLERGALVAGVMLASLLGLAWRRRLGGRALLAQLAWMGGVTVAMVALYVLVRHGFDFTSLNKRGPFLRAACAVCLVAALFGVGVHAAVWRDRRRLAADQATFVWLLLLVNLGHPFVYGWPLGFPLPGPILLFLPFMASIFLLLASAMLAGVTIAETIRPAATPRGAA